MADHDSELSARSVADLLTQASDQTATLVRQELELAKAELTIKGKQVGLESASAGADQLAATVQEKPLPFAVGAAFVLGLAIGWLLRRPS